MLAPYFFLGPAVAPQFFHSRIATARHPLYISILYTTDFCCYLFSSDIDLMLILLLFLLLVKRLQLKSVFS